MRTTIIVAEVGINHNGDINIAKKLIDGAIFCGVDIVKFQKRTINKVYSKEELDKPRESPWGTTNREQKLGLEFGEKEYDEIDRYCKEKGILWTASPWDLESVDFLSKYKLEYMKIPSARLGHEELIEKIAKLGKYTFISTGMSTLEEIGEVVSTFRNYECPFELMHCNSEYPLPHTKANLLMIKTLREMFNCKVGYSCHTADLITPCSAVVLGATSIEKHITLSRAMYGSDQSASVEVMGFYKLVDYIRSIEQALGNGEKTITEAEMNGRKKLWRDKDVG
uniref:Putative N-acetylneuraminate synthase n=1 Tax=viral metagenome TaxID=1070528 RepID=A0A6M3IIP5_9ZZZZ